MKKLLTILFLLVCYPAFAETYYAGTNGGSPAGTGGTTVCNGKTDADASVGTTPNCRFNHPNWALGAKGGVAGVMVGGDTLIINDEVFIGCVPASLDDENTDDCQDTTYNVGSSWGICWKDWASECGFNAPPSGEDSTHKTKIYGKGWDTGCATPIKLFGSNLSGTGTGAYRGINLTDKSNIDIRCLDVTDKIDSYGISYGIYAEDSSNVEIHNVNSHGLLTGIFAGRLTDWTLENVKINMNHNAGWDGDISGTDSNSGTMSFTNVEITYNGCYEDYSTGLPMDCCSQSQGCYGDGLGTGLTGGTWNFTGVNISHNTSDGLDLLYHTADMEVNIYRSLFEGNAGQAIKVPNKTHVENSFMIANCGYFAGQTFTRTPGFDNCRAAIAVSFSFSDETSPEIYNSTVLSNQDTNFGISGQCLAGASVIVKNSILRGGTEYLDGSDLSSVYYTNNSECVGHDESWCTTYGPSSGCEWEDRGEGYDCYGCPATFAETYNVCYGWKEGSSACNGTGSTDTVDPGFTGVILQGPASPGYYTDNDYWTQLYISAATGAADETASVVSSNDYNNFPRGAAWEQGALEFESTPAAPSCQTSCQECDSSGTCAASAYGCFWQLNGTCSTTIDPCNSSCTSCSSQAYCEASTVPCYYWTTNQCQATEEELPGDCDTDCTLCLTSQACLASTFTGGCYVQLSGTPICKSVEDSCNTYCGSCSTVELCSSSILGCNTWADGNCRSTAQPDSASVTGVTMSGVTFQ